MILFTAIFTFLFGLAFGSFLNVCISRLPRYESIVRPASHCPRCKRQIRTIDNIPLVSWFMLRGRCRYCSWTIPKRYPLIELGTAVLFLLDYLVYGLTFQAGSMAMLCLLLLGLAVMDAETLLLPDTFTFPGIAAGVLYSGLRGGWRDAGWSLLFALIAAGLLLIIRAAYWLIRRREGMGLGDAKLLALIAAWLGPGQTLLALFLGVVTAAIFGLITLAQKRRRPASKAMTVSGLRTSKALASPNGPILLPFGSFLCAGGIYAIFFGQQAVQWYMQFFR